MTPRTRLIALSLVLSVVLALPLLVSGACGGGDSHARVDLRDPGELGAFAAQVESEPERADDMLARAGITREELYQAILDVARDPEAAREYRDAFEAKLDGQA